MKTTQQLMNSIRILVMLMTAIAANLVVASEETDVAHLQQRWAEVNYQLEGRTQLSAFEQLVEQADQLSQQFPASAPVWIWSGIIKSTYAGAKGGLGALGLAKDAKKDLDKAMKIDANAMGGSASTTLGTLYHSVPGWPVGFGDEEKAEELLRRAVALSSEDIDANYFYGIYLLDEKRYEEAQNYLTRAQQAAPRPNRPIADTGRQQEISDALATLRSKI
jgi:tetratricopeptide (TPR) repeat protein